MLVRVVWLLLLICASSPSSARQPPRDPFASAQEIMKWIGGYRSRPEPERLPAAVAAMSRLGLFRDLEAGAVYVGFMAGVLGSEPERAERLVAAMFPMPPEDQVAIVRAIAYSGLPDWKELLRRFAERMPARKVLVARHLDDRLPTLPTLPLEGQPAALDTLWGYYFASANMAPVERIVAVLPWARDTEKIDRITIGSMAKWTLANNALQDKPLLDHLTSELDRQPPPVARELRDVIEAAETFETGKIRKEATAAMEELRRKGPESVRKFAFWGQAGQTALAFGCVVAGALGQPQIAVPCVIGGAASSAAMRIFAPQ